MRYPGYSNPKPHTLLLVDYLIVGRWVGVEIKRKILEYLDSRKPNMKESEYCVTVFDQSNVAAYVAVRWGKYRPMPGSNAYIYRSSMAFDPHTRTGSDTATQGQFFGVAPCTSGSDPEQYEGNRHS